MDLPESVVEPKTTAAEERLQLLTTLAEHQGELSVLRTAAAERLRDVHSLADERRTLEASFAWRFGFRPLRALAALIRG